MLEEIPLLYQKMSRVIKIFENAKKENLILSKTSFERKFKLQYNWASDIIDKLVDDKILKEIKTTSSLNYYELKEKEKKKEVQITPPAANQGDNEK